MNVEELIRDYLKDAIVMQIATTHENKPWICTVHFAYDEKFNLYWISRPDRRHSQEIANNTSIAGAIVLPHVVGQKVRGIQFEGNAQQITDPTEAREALTYFAQRFHTAPTRVENIIAQTD